MPVKPVCCSKEVDKGVHLLFFQIRWFIRSTNHHSCAADRDDRDSFSSWSETGSDQELALWDWGFKWHSSSSNKAHWTRKRKDLSSGMSNKHIITAETRNSLPASKWGFQQKNHKSWGVLHFAHFWHKNVRTPHEIKVAPSYSHTKASSTLSWNQTLQMRKQGNELFSMERALFFLIGSHLHIRNLLRDLDVKTWTAVPVRSGIRSARTTSTCTDRMIWFSGFFSLISFTTYTELGRLHTLPLYSRINFGHHKSTQMTEAECQHGETLSSSSKLFWMNNFK